MKRRYSLPSERPIIHPAELLRTGLPLLLALSFPPIAGYIWRGFAFDDWGWGIVGLLISASLVWTVWHGLLARTTERSGRVYHRYDRPVRYWLTMIVWIACYILSVAAFFFAQPSMSKRSPAEPPADSKASKFHLPFIKAPRC